MMDKQARWLSRTLAAAAALAGAAALPCAAILHAAPPASAGSAKRDTAGTLVMENADQERAFAEVFRRVNGWVEKGAFPGAVLAIGHHGRLVALKAFGRMSSSPDARAMPENALFDLASVTKVAATTTAAAILVDRGRLDLDAPVVRYLPDFARGAGHDKILVRHLLAHASGLFSTELLWKRAHDRQSMLAIIDAMPMRWEPGTHFQYRDENMMLVAEIVHRVSGQPLDRFLAQNAFASLDMPDTGFNPSRAKLDRIPPTEQDDIFRHRLVHGEVHDENAYVMGGVAGHAGLFSTATDLAHLAQMYLNRGSYGGRRIVGPDTVALFTSRQRLPADSSYALGWDTPGAFAKFAGPKASPDAILHSGFTGTSIYIDPARDAFVVLLTNRVNPTRENIMIRDARIDIHTAIFDTLDRAATKAQAKD